VSHLFCPWPWSGQSSAQSWINNSSKLLKIKNFREIDADLTIEGSGIGGVNFNGSYETAGDGGSGGLIVNLPNGMVTIWSDSEGRFAGQTIVRQGILSVGSINDYNINGTLGYNECPVILGGNGTTGTLKYTGDTIVVAGTLSIGNGGSGSSNLADASTVKIDLDAKMNLSFTGTDQIAELWLGGAVAAAAPSLRCVALDIARAAKSGTLYDSVARRPTFPAASRRFLAEAEKDQWKRSATKYSGGLTTAGSFGMKTAASAFGCADGSGAIATTGGFCLWTFATAKA